MGDMMGVGKCVGDMMGVGKCVGDMIGVLVGVWVM